MKSSGSSPAFLVRATKCSVPSESGVDLNAGSPRSIKSAERPEAIEAQFRATSFDLDAEISR